MAKINVSSVALNATANDMEFSITYHSLNSPVGICDFRLQRDTIIKRDFRALLLSDLKFISQ